MPKVGGIEEGGFVSESDVAAIVERKVAEATAAILQTIADARPDNAPARSGDDSFANSLALAIAKIGSQKTGEKYVDPEVLAKRDEARERMIRLIVEARERGDKPTYTVRSKIYFDEVMIDPKWIGPDHIARDTEIVWPGIPNLALKPIDAVAAAIFDAFNESIGGGMAIHEEGDMRVTAGGLVVINRGGHQRWEAQQTGAGQPVRGASGDGGLELRGRGMPGDVVQTAILGTIAPKARQQA
jgi:hypothetical protein